MGSGLTGPALANPALGPLPQPNDIVFVFGPDECTDDNGENQKLLPLFIDDRNYWKETKRCESTTGRITPDCDCSQPDEQQQCTHRRRQPEHRPQCGGHALASFEPEERREQMA